MIRHMIPAAALVRAQGRVREREQAQVPAQVPVREQVPAQAPVRVPVLEQARVPVSALALEPG